MLQLEELDILPRWAYTDNEWINIMKDVVLIEYGKYYIEKKQTEAEKLLDLF